MKSLVVKHKDGSFLFALIPGRPADLLAQAARAWWASTSCRCRRPTSPSKPPGYERGTITPLGSTTAWPVYADRNIAGRRISMGAGEHGYSAFVDADALTAALGAVLADISEPN